MTFPIISILAAMGTMFTAAAKQLAPWPGTVLEPAKIIHRPLQADTTLAFTRVTVVDVTDGRFLSEQTVVIVGNRIQAVGPAAQVQVPSGARVVDAQGKYLIPGLWDMHIHVAPISMAQGKPKYTRSLASGVTGLREMAQHGRHASDSFRVWRREIMTGIFAGPRGVGPSTDLFEVSTRDDVAQLIDSLKAAGTAFVTLDPLKYRVTRNSSGDRDLYFTILREARRVGLPLVGHVPRTVPSAEAADSGVRSIEHFDGLRPCWPAEQWHTATWDSLDMAERCGSMTQALIRNGTWVMPALFVSKQDGLPGGDSLKKGRDERAAQVVRAMYHLGFRQFLAGSGDSRLPVPSRTPFVLQQELITLVQDGGLPPLEALRAATLHPAQFFEATDSLGSIAPGKLADLVLLNANPLADIRNVQRLSAVVANGRYFDRATLIGLAPKTRPSLGVSYVRNKQIEVAANNGDSAQTRYGYLIEKWDLVSPLREAGAELLDIIIAIDGVPVSSAFGIYTLAQDQNWQPGQTVKVEVVPTAERMQLEARRVVEVTLW